MLIYIILGLCVIALIVAIVETRLLRVKHYTIDSQNSNLKKNIKIALISDMHCTVFGKNNKRLIDKIADLNCDFLIVAGDVINGKPDDLSYALDFFKGIKEKGIKTYYFYGNHEQKLSMTDEKSFEDYGSEIRKFVETVNNDTVVLDGITLKGLLIPLKMYRDKISEIEKYFNAVQLVGEFDNDGNYHILVAHDPTFASMYDAVGADLILSGHLHGGIIRIPFLGGVITPRHKLFTGRTRGIYDQGKGKILITSGIGWHAIPLRFCNDPEICMIEIRSSGYEAQIGS
ncbi:MAG: metallophosphoesterase [Lachnospiraceae bacterium]|nr:metallophosphoesterase [Lachnospiraceae bacterium]